MYELNQYTGLKDKNGVEIYEGDILLHCTVKYKIIFHSSAFCAEYPLDVCRILYELVTEEDHSVKVIGNIYETKNY